MALQFLDLEVSDHVEDKINGMHQTSVDDVLDALEGLLFSVWDDDPRRGLRLLAYGTAGTRRICVVLYPVDADRGMWRLATAYPDPGR